MIPRDSNCRTEPCSTGSHDQNIMLERIHFLNHRHCNATYTVGGAPVNLAVLIAAIPGTERLPGNAVASLIVAVGAGTLALRLFWSDQT